MKVVVALQKLISEFCEAHSIHAGISGEAFFHGILCHHIVHRDVFSDILCKVQEGKILHPVVIVDQDSSVVSIAVKFQKSGQLIFKTVYIVE